MKTLYFFTEPINILFVLTFIGTISFYLNFRKISLVFLSFTTFCFFSFGYTPISEILLNKLEENIPAPDLSLKTLNGVLVLGGGGGAGRLPKYRNEASLGEGAERFTKALELLQKYPQMKILFSGKGKYNYQYGWNESQVAKKFYLDVGVSSKNLIFENNSVNTYQNLIFSSKKIKDGEVWGLITSAFHMKRISAVLKKIGSSKKFILIPVDYRTDGLIDLKEFNLSKSIEYWKIVIHENLGFLFYKLKGYI